MIKVNMSKNQELNGHTLYFDWCQEKYSGKGVNKRSVDFKEVFAEEYYRTYEKPEINNGFETAWIEFDSNIYKKHEEKWIKCNEIV